MACCPFGSEWVHSGHRARGWAKMASVRLRAGVSAVVVGGVLWCAAPAGAAASLPSVPATQMACEVSYYAIKGPSSYPQVGYLGSGSCSVAGGPTYSVVFDAGGTVLADCGDLACFPLPFDLNVGLTLTNAANGQTVTVNEEFVFPPESNAFTVHRDGNVVGAGVDAGGGSQGPIDVAADMAWSQQVV